MDISTLEAAQRVAADVLANVGADQLEAPTPCAKWNVSELIDHMVGAQLWATAGVQNTDMTETGQGAGQGDFNQVFAEAAQGCLNAFAEDGAMDRIVNPGFGDMPAPALLGMAATDTFTHAWDLAKATGQDTNLDPALADQLLDGARASIQEAFRSEEGSIFGPEQTPAADADSATKLAAFLGRSG